MNRLWVFLLLSISFISHSSSFAGDFENSVEFDAQTRTELLRQLGLNRPEYQDLRADSQIGVVVIDNSFGDPKVSPELFPARFEIVNSYDDNFLARNSLPLGSGLYRNLRDYIEGDIDVSTIPKPKSMPHGLRVVHSILGVLGRDTRVKFYLLNGRGIPNFSAAVLYAQELFRQGLVKTVVNSTLFTNGGMGNGRGPLDLLVEKITRNPGLTFFQAAGNDGGKVWSGKAILQPQSSYVRTSDAKNGCLRFTNSEPGNTVTVSLVWDGHQRALTDGTTVDYDLEIYDPRGRLVNSKDIRLDRNSAERGKPGTMVQVFENPFGKMAPGTSGESLEEVILEDVPETTNGSYCIRVKAMSADTYETDDLQVVIRSESEISEANGGISNAVVFLDSNRVNEMLPPASAPGVISVGSTAGYSSQAENSSGRTLPSVMTAADIVKLNTKRWFRGTSFSAPFLAGVKILMETSYPDFKREDFFRLLTGAPGPVTLDYVKRNTRNGITLVQLLLDRTGLRETDVKAYLTDEGTTLLALPEYPARYGQVFPNYQDSLRDRMHLYEYYYGLQQVITSARTQSYDTISYYRALPTEERAGGLRPWEDLKNMGSRRPYDLVNPYRNFEADDFIRLERQVSSQDLDSLLKKYPGDSSLMFRKGTASDQPRRAYFKMPSKETLRRLLENR